MYDENMAKRKCQGVGNIFIFLSPRKATMNNYDPLDKANEKHIP